MIQRQERVSWNNVILAINKSDTVSNAETSSDESLHGNVIVLFAR